MPPVDYLRMSYYERWLHRLAAQVVQYGLVTQEEIESGTAGSGLNEGQSGVHPRDVCPLARAGAFASSQDPSVRPLFKVRQRVRARNINPTGHTRLPRYARGKTGVIVRDHGVYLFPDSNAHFQGEKRQHVYSVRFAARELWGDKRVAARLGAPRPVGRLP